MRNSAFFDRTATMIAVLINTEKMGFFIGLGPWSQSK